MHELTIILGLLAIVAILIGVGFFLSFNSQSLKEVKEEVEEEVKEVIEEVKEVVEEVKKTQPKKKKYYPKKKKQEGK